MQAYFRRGLNAAGQKQRETAPLQRRAQSDEKALNINAASQFVFVGDTLIDDDVQEQCRAAVGILISGFVQRDRSTLSPQPCCRGSKVSDTIGHDARGEGPEGGAFGIEGVLAPPQVEDEVLLEILEVHARHGPLPREASCGGADVPHHLWV